MHVDLNMDTEQGIGFRQQKAEEYPDDHRNQKTVDALSVVQQELEAEGGQHPTLSRIAAVLDHIEKRHPTFEIGDRWSDWSSYVSRFGGFNGGAGLTSFLDGLLDMVESWKEEAEERRAEYGRA